MEGHATENITRQTGPRRVVCGPNWPNLYSDLAVEALRRAKFGREAEELIFGGNLARLLKMDRRDEGRTRAARGSRPGSTARSRSSAAHGLGRAGRTRPRRSARRARVRAETPEATWAAPGFGSPARQDRLLQVNGDAAPVARRRDSVRVARDCCPTP